MKPYYQDEQSGITIYHGDCLQIMKEFPDNSFDLCLTDPPYGINICKSGTVGGENLAKVKDYGKCEWDSKIPTKEYFDEMFRLSTNQIIFGGNYFIEHLTNTPCFIVWDKNNTENFADCELAWTSFKSATKMVKFTWNGFIQGNMKEKDYRQHPTQKPNSVMKWILRKYSEPNQTILDPFLGSGTTLVACKELGRKGIGIEISEEYCAIAKKRIQNTQKDLFL